MIMHFNLLNVMKIKYTIPSIILLILNISCSNGNYATFETGAKLSVNLNASITSVKYDSLTNKMSVEGKVFDLESKSPIIGANISLLPGSEINTAARTDTSGIFKLEFDPAKFDSLEISYIGYHKKRTLVNKLTKGSR